MEKGTAYQVSVDEILYEPHFIIIYAGENASDKALQKMAIDFILKKGPTVSKADFADGVVVEPAGLDEEPDVVAEGYHFPKTDWCVKLGLLYAQAVHHATYHGDEFDEVAYVRDETQAKRFKTETEAKAFAQWLNPACEVVKLQAGDDHD